MLNGLAGVASLGAPGASARPINTKIFSVTFYLIQDMAGCRRGGVLSYNLWRVPTSLAGSSLNPEILHHFFKTINF
jgi:hypothetical protein